MGIFVFTQLKDPEVKISQTNLQEKFSTFEKEISNSLAKSPRGGFLPNEAIHIILIGTHKMKKLNFLYRKKNYATDVLTFLGERGLSEHYADIFICIPIAKRQAKKYGLTLFEELIILSVHGIVHASGLDHEKKFQEKIFRNLEATLLSYLLEAKHPTLLERSYESPFVP